MLSIGWVPVDGGRVDLSGAGHLGIGDAGDVGHSATIHGITDDALAGGAAFEQVLGELLVALRGRVLLAHFARIETGFLGAACERFWGAGLPVEVVDTFELERRALGGGWDAASDPGALRLWAARARYGLPVYRAHEALTDALACAELYLAQRAALEAALPGDDDDPPPRGGVRVGLRAAGPPGGRDQMDAGGGGLGEEVDVVGLADEVTVDLPVPATAGGAGGAEVGGEGASLLDGERCGVHDYDDPAFNRSAQRDSTEE